MKKKKNNRFFFDDDGHFVPPQLAAHFLETENFLYDRGCLYYFDGKIYLPSAETFIKEKCLGILKDDYRDSRGVEVFRQIETKLQLNSPKLDQDPTWLILKNGALDWRTGELIPHNPEILSSIYIPLTFDPTATCPKIDQFFKDILEADCLELVYEISGYCLIPSMVAKKSLLLHGKADGGKTRFIDLIRKFIGEKNSSSISLQDLAENRFRAAGLAGKLINTFPDLNNSPLKLTGIFKALVSGDCIQVENKGQHPFDLYNKARFIFSANEIPRSYDQTDSFYIRWIILRFPNSFPTGSPKRDPDILEKLTTESELSGLLNKALAGLRVFMEKGDFAIPETAKIELEKYRGENENVRVFLETQCVVEDEYQISKSDLYKHYEDYCKARQFSKFSQGRFNAEVIKFNEQVYESRRKIGTGYVRVWSGLNLTIEAQKSPFGSNSDDE